MASITLNPGDTIILRIEDDSKSEPPLLGEFKICCWESEDKKGVYILAFTPDDSKRELTIWEREIDE